MHSIDDIKALLEASRSNEAIDAANALINAPDVPVEVRAEAFYLRGNAYRQLSDWRMAINSYLEARELNPAGPAAMAYDNAQQILAFFNKDLYNP